MAIVETFSRRQKRLREEVVDVFTYDEINPALRVQIVNIWDDALGTRRANRGSGGENPAYRDLHRMLATEFGVFRLSNNNDNYSALVNFFCSTATTEQALDIIELSVRTMLAMHGQASRKLAYNIKISPSEAISDLNERFLQHGVGYAFVEDGLVRKDNEHLHQEVILPALKLVHQPGFEGANEEYRQAHEYYRHRKHKDCLTNCLKAFESTMKTICMKRGWPYQPTDTASALIKVCIEQGLFPASMESHLGTLQSFLGSAIPTVRNKMGGHGQGPEPLPVPAYFAEYLLHETATTIILLVNAFQDARA